MQWRKSQIRKYLGSLYIPWQFDEKYHLDRHSQKFNGKKKDNGVNNAHK